MKITSIELLPASKYLFIKVHTDEGIHGTGEVGAWGYLDEWQAGDDYAVELINKYLTKA